jgi:hypothetical protein
MKFWERLWVLHLLLVASRWQRVSVIERVPCCNNNAGRLAKKECAAEFSRRGCNLCMSFLESEDALTIHRLQCQFPYPCPAGKVISLSFSTSALHRSCMFNPVSMELFLIWRSKAGVETSHGALKEKNQGHPRATVFGRVPDWGCSLGLWDGWRR